MAELISVIVTTYKREDALARCCALLSRQSDRGFRGDRRRRRLRAGDRGARRGWQAKSRPPPRACLARRPRLSRRRNSQSRHARLARRLLHFPRRRLPRAPRFRRRAPALGRAAAGSSAAIACCSRAKRRPVCCATGSSLSDGEPCDWLARARAGGVNRHGGACPFPLGPLRKLRSGAWQGARSCNLAIWRADLDRVDGFDADYSGWGKEDSDIIVRLLHAGCGARTAILPSASSICGIRKPIAPG